MDDRIQDLLKDLGINITEQETSSGSEEKRADSSKSSTPLVEKIRESFDSTPLTFDEETIRESSFSIVSAFRDRRLLRVHEARNQLPSNEK